MLVLLFSLLFPIVLFILDVMGNLENICYSLETDYSDYNIWYIYELCDEIIKNEQMRNLNTWKKNKRKIRVVIGLIRRQNSGLFIVEICTFNFNGECKKNTKCGLDMVA